MDCATRGPWRELPTFSHFLWYSRRKCKVGENAVLGLSKPELVRNACFYIELVSVTYGFSKTSTFHGDCLSSTIFASKADVESLKSGFESKLSALREEFISKQCSPSIPVNYFPESLPISSNPSSQVSVYVINSTQSSQTSHQNEAVSTDKPHKEPSRKILFVGDSLLHRMDVNKMKVSDICSVKLTKRGDSLMGSMSRCRNYVAKHSDEILDVVLLASTNDLSNKNSCPEDLIKDLDSALTDLTHVSNVQHVFIYKIPPRLDFHNINNKVSEFNSLLSERFSDTEEHISVVDTILPEFRYYYVDGLHFSHFGLRKVCSIILSNLYKVLAPSKHKKHKSSGTAHAKSRSSELKLGCLNVQPFRTAQAYFSELIDSFDIFAISEHCLFAEQLEILEASTNYT